MLKRVKNFENKTLKTRSKFFLLTIVVCTNQFKTNFMYQWVYVTKQEHGQFGRRGHMSPERKESVLVSFFPKGKNNTENGDLPHEELYLLSIRSEFLSNLL